MMRIEATYLIKKMPDDLKNHHHEEILQGYFVDSKNATRIRKKGDSYSITRKLIPIPGDSSYREHIEVPILKTEFLKLWPLVIKKVQKTRYYYSPQPGGTDVRIDVFTGKQKGLILIELIFPDENELKSFVAPDWFGREVTQKPWASNSEIAQKSFSQIEKIIAEK